VDVHDLAAETTGPSAAAMSSAASDKIGIKPNAIANVAAGVPALTISTNRGNRLITLPIAHISPQSTSTMAIAIAPRGIRRLHLA
jgi:hypothetical protein